MEDPSLPPPFYVYICIYSGAWTVSSFPPHISRQSNGNFSIQQAFTSYPNYLSLSIHTNWHSLSIRAGFHFLSKLSFTLYTNRHSLPFQTIFHSPYNRLSLPIQAIFHSPYIQIGLHFPSEQTSTSYPNYLSLFIQIGLHF